MLNLHKKKKKTIWFIKKNILNIKRAKKIKKENGKIKKKREK